MRGKPHGRALDSLSCGLIPAHAGKTWSWFYCRPHCPAHPRACGENLRIPLSRPETAGSSPRMRGKLSFAITLLTVSRLIPAHAGKTSRVNTANTVARAHPRACGENVSVALMCLSSVGSSPRMRGKPKRSSRCGDGSRLIPAHAGKTEQAFYDGYRSQAHPRACGENCVACVLSGSRSGSSPRMRGKRCTVPARA